MALSLSDIISGKAVSQEQPARPGNKRARSDSAGSSSSQSTQPSRPPRSIPVLISPPYQQTAPGRGRSSNQAAAVAASAAILPAVAAPDPAASLQTSSLAAVAISGIGPGVATTVASATTSQLLWSAFPSSA